MSGSVLTLTIIWLLFCTQSSQQSVCPTSCCECSLGGQELHCNGLQEFPHFCNVPTALEKLELENFDKAKLHRNFKKFTKFEYLIIKQSPINILCDLIDGQKSLNRLKLIGITITESCGWDRIFAQFTNLTDFHLEGTDLSAQQLLVINGKADKNNNMISFSVNKCGIKSIKSNVITEWIHLKIISLAHNCIDQLDKHWLPLKLESLWSLDLSYNNISMIPSDYFSGMTALRKLRLDNNRFMTLKEEWFFIIWDGLHELWIDNNNIKCTPELSWVPQKKIHPTFFDEATCSSNKIKGIIYLNKLRLGDATLIDDDPPTPCTGCPPYQGQVSFESL